MGLLACLDRCLHTIDSTNVYYPVILEPLLQLRKIGWLAHVCNLCPSLTSLIIFVNLTLDQCDSREHLVQFLHCFRLIHKGETRGLQGVALKELFKAQLSLRWNSTSHALIGRCYCTVCCMQCALCIALMQKSEQICRDPPCF